ncbi:hypothetical protein Rhal01_03574 [Rubritalea halochordaticola]|uniref:Zinc ribbon domain-containing protein n=1 Tax=Rubritalea halochordaticola TaxID=714537 RepID=A0ABP9V5Q9_9BACT
MLDKLKDFAVKKGYDIARSKGVKCPKCAQKLLLPPVMPKEGLDAEFDCASCGWSGSLSQVMEERREQRDGKLGEAVPKPEKSKIVEADIDGGKSWLIPAKKGVGFLMVFGAIWLSFTLFMSLMFIFGDPVDSNTGEPASKWTILFFVPFWLVGIGVLYAGLRMRYTEVMVLADEHRVRMMKRFFSKVKETTLEIEQVDFVSLKESYRSNDRPVYAVSISEKEGGKGLSFGSELSDDEKRWLVSSIQQVLPSSRMVDSSGSLQIASSADKEEFSHKGMKLERIGQEGFRFTRLNQGGKWAMLIGIVFMVVSFIVVRSGLDGFGPDTDNWFELIFTIFEIIPFLIGAVFGFVGLLLVLGGFSSIGREEVFEFGKDSLVVETRKKGAVVKGVTHPRDSFRSVDSTNSGHVNNSPRYRVKLKGKKFVKLCSFVPEEVAADLQAWVEGWLIKKPEPSTAKYGESMKA